MRSSLILLALMAFLSAANAAHAQDGQFTATPVCSDLINDTGHSVYGAVETDRATAPDGDVTYYKSNFRLKAGEKTQICSNGPFFTGGKLTLTLRSLFPLFECKTSLGQPISIKTQRNERGGLDWSATCY